MWRPISDRRRFSFTGVLIFLSTLGMSEAAHGTDHVTQQMGIRISGNESYTFDCQNEPPAVLLAEHQCTRVGPSSDVLSKESVEALHTFFQRRSGAPPDTDDFTALRDILTSATTPPRVAQIFRALDHLRVVATERPSDHSPSLYSDPADHTSGIPDSAQMLTPNFDEVASAPIPSQMAKLMLNEGPRRLTSPFPSDCPATCLGPFTCEDWSSTHSCFELEASSGCDCSGCDCSDSSATASPTSTAVPTASPTSTLVPSISSVPSEIPTQSPTPKPSTASPTSCFDLFLYDSFGDGWNGNRYLLRDTTTNAVVVSGTLESGGFDVLSLCLGSGCYSFAVTDEGNYHTEISWTFGATSGEAPYLSQFLVADGAVSGPFEQSCPTLAPTVSLSPSSAPTSTPIPSVTFVPSKLPTTIPTPSPTASVPFEARTWAELDSASQVDRARVDVKQDIQFTESINMEDQQAVTVFCGNATDFDVEYCATLDGVSSTLLFNVHSSSILRLFHLRITGGCDSVSILCMCVNCCERRLFAVTGWCLTDGVCPHINELLPILWYQNVWVSGC